MNPVQKAVTAFPPMAEFSRQVVSAYKRYEPVQAIADHYLNITDLRRAKNSSMFILT